MKPTVCLVTCTKNRHRHLERVVRFVLNQTYSGKLYHLIYNNSEIPLELDDKLDVNKFLLVNNHLSYSTGKPYVTLGEIYNDAITHIPEDTDIVNMMDDDDIYLPDHVEEGVKGILRHGKLAYKPKKSWYRHLKSISLQENTLEPSIFVDFNHLKQYGFSLETTAQHLQWIDPLITSNQIIADPDGKPTYICDWSQDIPTFKTSGNPNNPQNFKNYSDWSKDKGDGIITPCTNGWAEHYYKL